MSASHSMTRSIHEWIASWVRNATCTLADTHVVVSVVDPFGNVANHIIESPAVWLFAANRHCRRGVSWIPRDRFKNRIDILTIARHCQVTVVRRRFCACLKCVRCLSLTVPHKSVRKNSCNPGRKFPTRWTGRRLVVVRTIAFAFRAGWNVALRSHRAKQSCEPFHSPRVASEADLRGERSCKRTSIRSARR